MSFSQFEVQKPNAADKQFDARVLISIGAILALALVFWFGSRYPALNEKALMGGDAPLSGLAFDILFDIFPDSSLWWQFIANTFNWVYTNIKGMTFGVLFGAAIITFLSLIKKRAFESSFANAALGTAIGAPLGVCVNCAAPIAFGLHMGRMRLETTLSALIASPTLNVIVVTMSFSLLPIHVALTKLVLAIVMVLFVVPMLCKYVLVSETQSTRNGTAALANISEARGLTAWIGRSLAPMDAGAPPATLFAALLWFVRTYSRNLFFISIITVPMMFVAGMLGAIVAMSFDSAALYDSLPRAGIVPILLAMCLVALIASIAPAPIALDVILTVVLMGVGMASHFATVVLIALGSYSVYAFFILWRAVSPRTAMVVWISTILLAVTGGVIAKETSDFETHYYVGRMEAFLDNKVGFDLPRIAPLAKATTLDAMATDISTQRLVPKSLEAEISTSEASLIAIQSLPQSAKSLDALADQGTVFSRIPGPELGFEDVAISTPIHEFAPGMMLGGIAAGDIHNDGWIDIAVRRPTGAHGLSLYTNISGSFKRQHIDLGPLAEMDVVNVAFADLDNDGWLDLVVTTFWDGMFILTNQQGQFSQQKMRHIASEPLTMARTIAFSDMNNDGLLDIIVGDYVSGQGFAGWTKEQPLASKNHILWNEGRDGFRKQDIAGAAGQTLTMLVSDLNRDGRPDLYKGDDVAGTDQVVFFNSDGTSKVDRDLQPFDYALDTTMSMDEGDWNNDLIPDYYAGQISDRGSSAQREAMRGDGRVLLICQQFARDLGWRSQQTKECAAEILSVDSIRGLKSTLQFNTCQSHVMSERDRTVCGVAKMLMYLKAQAFHHKEFSVSQAHTRCHQELERWPFAKNYCDTFMLETVAKPSKEDQEALFMPVLKTGNILMTGSQSGTFEDDASEQGVSFPGWTWNSRFADLDQDGWQDLLVMAGIWLSPSRSTTNVFYKNEQGRFSKQTDAYGFHDVVPSFSFVSLDYDRDGDIDVIRPPDGRIAIVHRNEQPAGPALWVNLRDEIGNRMGIGARVTICVNGTTEVSAGDCQTRPINASGGFMSFDPIAAHFGLGTAKSVDLIEVVWRDGEVTRILPKDLAGGEVVVTRKSVN
ncbi:FG-GAP-like repeat-containing protein [Planktotalea sp.]|uniref:FG-GAP-like repeat-containing protein n=1 Tax=Planktotalea sp. TaxID=2029877 RepID=UPI003297E279